jgi:hypothetical protein
MCCIALVAVLCMFAGCGPPYRPATYKVTRGGNLWTGGLDGKSYELVQDVLLLRELGKTPVLVPTEPERFYSARRPLSPSRARNGAWGDWGKRHLAHYVRDAEFPHVVPASAKPVPRGHRVTIRKILCEVIGKPPPVYYVLARLEGEKFTIGTVDVSTLIEDEVPPASSWRKLPRVANDCYLRPLPLDRSHDLGRNWADLMTALNHYDWALRYRAAELLPEADASDARIVERLLITMLPPGDPEVRYKAVESLGQMGPRARAAVPTLLAVMKNEDNPEGLSRRAADALARIDPTVLEEALRDRDWRLRFVAGQGLASLGPEAAFALPALLDVLVDSDGRDYEAPPYYGAAIFQIQAHEGVATVVELAGADHRRRAMDALKGMGPAGQSARQRLLETARARREAD